MMRLRGYLLLSIVALAACKAPNGSGGGDDTPDGMPGKDDDPAADAAVDDAGNLLIDAPAGMIDAAVMIDAPPIGPGGNIGNQLPY